MHGPFSVILDSTLPHNVQLLAEFSSQRVDETMSPQQYSKFVSQFVADGDYHLVHKCLPFYLLFTLAAQVHQTGRIDEVAAAYLLHQDTARPLIDQYCNLVRLLRHLMCSGQSLDLLENEDMVPFLRIGEAELGSLAITLGGDSAQQMQSEFREAHEMFLERRFDQLLNVAQRNIARDPLELQWYEWVVRASLEMRRDLPQCVPQDSPSYALLDAVLRYSRYDRYSPESSSRLLRKARSLEGLPIGYQIAGFCQRATPLYVVDRCFGPIIYGGQFPPQCVPLLPKLARDNVVRYLKKNAGPVLNSFVETLQSLTCIGVKEANCQVLSPILRLSHSSSFLAKYAPRFCLAMSMD